MGLFGFKKKEKQIVIPEPNKSEVDWFFTEEAKNTFETWVKENNDEMWEVEAEKGIRGITGATLEKGNIFRKEYPCTFFADYLRALKTMDSPWLAFYAANLALDGDEPGIPYPNCLKPEFNPLINFAIKIKPIYYKKRWDEALDFNTGMACVIVYLFQAFIEGVDESNQSWLYEKSFWFDEKDALRKDWEIKMRLNAIGTQEFLEFMK